MAWTDNYREHEKVHSVHAWSPEGEWITASSTASEDIGTLEKQVREQAQVPEDQPLIKSSGTIYKVPVFDPPDKALESVTERTELV